MNFENILLEKKNSIAYVTVNRPKVLNALNMATMEELRAAFHDIKMDAAIRVVIFTGSGEKAFIAGADISELAKHDAVSGKEYTHRGQNVLNLIENLGKPVIACINGFALGGGCEIAMACTLRLASDNAKLGQPEVKLGIIPGYGGTQRLPRLVGKGLAMQMVLAGEMISAKYESVMQGAEVSPGTMLSLLNHQLYHSTPLEKYATLFLGMYDSEARRLMYSNAGHLPPLLLGEDGSCCRLERGGTVVGLFDEIPYDEDTVQLRPGDIFLAYSDGVTEPENDYGEFGEERLIALVQENRDLPLRRITEIVTSAVDDWIGAAEQPDDVTLVLARVR